jgi:protein-L-isoaspartate(D-aspartate) O-methyltransferase
MRTTGVAADVQAKIFLPGPRRGFASASFVSLRLAQFEEDKESMICNERLGIARRIYAKQVVHAADADDPRLESVLAELPRERFLPPGPWLLSRWRYQATPDNDPIYLYQDVPVAIAPERHLNNGQPSFITRLIAQGRPQLGDTVVHIGTGTGYYTAVLAHLVGAGGHVFGVEHDPKLADWAAAELGDLPQVHVAAGDGAAMPLPSADLILVNAGAALPAATWLRALKPGGRLVLPLTAETIASDTPITQGVVFLIQRRGDDDYVARCVSTVMIYPCVGARDPDAISALALALRTGGQDRVKALRRSEAVDDKLCWLRGPDWSFGYA